MYSVKEIFYTLQGEGANAGRAAVFCRFAGCNLWNGREADRAAAVCQFCDTDFVGTDGDGGGKFRTAESLAQACRAVCSAHDKDALVVLTGGEPMLQVDQALADALHAAGFTIAIETNGTLPVIDGVDWICVSPKAGSELLQTSGHELKLVYPQSGVDPAAYLDLDFKFRFLQPMDGPAQEANTRAAVAYCKANPAWRLSLQTHKMLGIP
ncbi:7-carboxy-7-deazaguanine synthase [Hyphomicrobium methylovorum]|uniref:7-carboxy-7-deazaguanine synthase n=1 Tax=Hyphomicrobium methylovorum TaxID=84 RepID=UPI0015E7A510|nr:7-carboxy-7-deazaguanine synthase [Hyphomicrobium methylovorum]MBA2124780.1 7-carboxy-7-deazaguanine synthase [Hyphomicrobium methylovorum]